MSNSQDRIMKSYEFRINTWPGYGRFQKKVAGYVPKKSVVLEIGTGLGHTTTEIAKKAMNVLTIEKNSKVASIAKKRFKDIKKIRLLESNIFSTDFGKTRFDCIVIVFVIHDMKKREQKKIIRIIYKLLKNNGTLIIGDKISYNDKKMQSKAFNRAINMIKNSKYGDYETKKDWIKHYFYDQDHQLKESKFMKMIKDSGFSNVRKTYRNNLDTIIIARK